MEKKFRGKRVDNGKWAFGDLITDGNKHYLNQKVGFVSKERADWASHYMEVFVLEIDLETVGQLIDIINDTEIYEGDVIGAYKHNEEKHILETCYSNGCYMAGCWNWHEFLNKFRRVKVVGNIYK